MSLVDEIAQSLASRSEMGQRAKGSPEAAGNDIVAMLQQAAERAKENEHLARTKARSLMDHLTKSERRIEELEKQVALAEQRAVDSEAWVVRVCKEVRDGWVGLAVKQGS
jgi:predicted  nucleic acid-binding Zn-ribbon protein